MAANFLHGAETITVNKGPRPVRVVKSAVIGLIGVSPKGPRQQLVQLLAEKDAAQFGFGSFSGGTIAPALNAIFTQGAGTVLVINVYNPAVHNENITNEAVAVQARVFKLSKYPIGAITVKSGATTVYTGTNYTVTDTGQVTLPTGTVIANGNYTVDYATLDLSAVSSANIIGSIDSNSGVRTGSKLLQEAYNTYGYVPRLLIAPVFSSIQAVSTELIALAEKYRGHALLDAPAGTTVSVAIAGRGPNGVINFNTSSKRAILCYPYVRAYDASIDATILQPYSQFLAGVIAATDNEFGYWFSPSNKEINGITGTEIKLSAAVNDAQTDVNALNEVGIVTIFNSFGTGLRTWGNRSASFPTSTTVDNFISVQRTADIVHESLELAMLQFIDQPITQAVIDAIRETGNQFLRTLIGRGAVIDGSVTYDPAKNPQTELAAGHLTFDIEFIPPTPAERITFESFLNIELLQFS